MTARRRTWEDLVDDVVEVCRTLVPHRVGWIHGEVTREMVETILRGRDGTDLADTDARRDVTASAWSARDVVEGRPVRDPTRALAAKVALVVADLREGRVDRVQPWEAEAVARALGLEPPIAGPVRPAPDPRPARVGSDVPVEFAFPWRPSPVRTGGRLGTATAHTPMTVVDPAEAPVACSLWTPDGRMAVRRLGTTWLRPVLSPGSWRPVDVSGFSAAAANGRAWRDNPFLPRTGRCCPTFDLGDLAARRALARGDERRIADARDACLARAGQLFVGDGSVHRTTEAPLAGIGTVFVDGTAAAGPMWIMGDLCSASSMGTLGCDERPAAFWFNRTAVPEPHGPDARSGFAQGEGLLPSATWSALTGILGTAAARRWSTGGPWPWDAVELVSGVASEETADAVACLRTAVWHAGRLSLVTSVSMHEASGPHASLRARSEDLAAAFGDGTVGVPTLAGLRDGADEVLALSTHSPDPLANMWAYVAAIAAYVASHELALRETDEDVTFLRL